jgi:hypothetical protein
MDKKHNKTTPRWRTLNNDQMELIRTWRADSLFFMHIVSMVEFTVIHEMLFEMNESNVVVYTNERQYTLNKIRDKWINYKKEQYDKRNKYIGIKSST